MNWQPVPKRCGHWNDSGKYRGEGGKNTFSCSYSTYFWLFI